jgi:hypothetical protein
MDGRSLVLWVAAFVANVGRRALPLGLLAVVTLVGGGRAWVQEARGASDPESVVIDYYRAIVGRDYAAAYADLGTGLRSQTLAQFSAGFADTAYVDALVLGATRSGNGFAVPVRILAWHNDGTIHRYVGSYTVGVEDGADKLIAAAITEAPSPSWVPPLCRTADLDVTSTNDAGAGNRFATFTLTNTSAAVCVLGGFPAVELRDDPGPSLIEAVPEPQQAIATVTLESGQAASFDLRWVNWCGAPTNGLTAVITLPGDNAHPLQVAHPIGVPPCLGEGQHSDLTMRPFAAAT